VSHWLIVAGSARALARSCVDAGWRCDVIDPFADCDTARLAHRLERGALSGDHFDQRLPPLVRSMAGGWCGIVAGSGFEAVPSMLDELDSIAPVFGNDATTVARCKAPMNLAETAHRAGVRCAEVDISGPVAGDDWLMKPIGGCGGIGVRAARAGEQIAEGWFAQRRIDGVPASVLFLADGHDARIVGVTRQYPGSVAGPYAWCEAVSDLPLSAAQHARLARDVAALTQQFGLRGLNGADLVFDGEHAVLIEINPRPTATMMLYEQRVAGGLFAAHVAACEGRLDEVGLLARHAADRRRCGLAGMECRPAAGRQHDGARDAALHGACHRSRRRRREPAAAAARTTTSGHARPFRRTDDDNSPFLRRTEDEQP
jgi:predicted ATP-grasp superfamily ATP-dependent carboligase